MNFKKDLLKLVKESCDEYKVQFYVGTGKYVTYNGKFKSNGFFDSEVPKLAITTNVKNWELILVHEYCHLRQWIENCIHWRKYVRLNGDLISEWIDGNKIDKRGVTRQINALLNLERDCEQRSVKILQSFNVSQKAIDQYIQKANAYTIFYLFVLKHKKWYKIGQEPYNIPKVWKSFSNSFDIDVQQEFEKNEHLYWNCVDA